MSDNINSTLWKLAGDGEEALVSQLIEKGAEVDWRDGRYNRTALHEAAWGGHTPVVSRLLDSGWSLDTRKKFGFTPLAWAAGNGHLETVKCLLLWGANIDTQDDDKNTPLHDASSRGYTDMVQLLLQCGANQEIRNKDGETAERRRQEHQEQCSENLMRKVSLQEMSFFTRQ